MFLTYVGNVWLGSLASIDVFRYLGNMSKVIEMVTYQFSLSNFVYIFLTLPGLFTLFTTLTLDPSILESPEYLVPEPTTCVYVEYLGEVSKMTLKAVYHDSSTYVVFEDRYFVPCALWRSLAVKY